jgi:hypothetical protein
LATYSSTACHLEATELSWVAGVLPRVAIASLIFGSLISPKFSLSVGRIAWPSINR